VTTSRSFYITASCMPSAVLLQSALCKASQDDELSIRYRDITWFEVQISRLNHFEKVPAGEPCCSSHFPVLFPIHPFSPFRNLFLPTLTSNCTASNWHRLIVRVESPRRNCSGSVKNSLVNLGTATLPDLPSECV
jgi:hypothetical protein